MICAFLSFVTQEYKKMAISAIKLMSHKIRRKPAAPSARRAELAQLLLVGDGVAAEPAVDLNRVAAHPDQRRRVGVDGHRGLGAGVEDAVDVAGPEVEGGAGGGETRDRRLGRAAEDQALLADAAGDDGDGAGREVMVVKAGVV